MAIPFVKLHGAGNDYIAIDGRECKRDWGELALRMCAQHFGVGSDGIVVVLPSEQAAVKMRIFNPDGSEAEMSGNGVRLFAKFVLDREIATAGSEGLTVETLAGIRMVTPNINNGVMTAGRVSIGKPVFVRNAIPIKPEVVSKSDQVVIIPLEIAGMSIEVICLSVGNPHAVALLDDSVDNFPLEEIGPLVENHRFFPNRINFEIANVIDRGHIKARIFERGAGETLSSGTGSSAICVAAKIRGLIDDDVEILVPGGTLKLSWSCDGDIFLEGPVTEVFSGMWLD